MPTFTAGAAVSGFNTRRALPRIAVTASSISVVSSELCVDIPGLSVRLDPLTTYAVDGYIAHTSGSTSADVRLGLSVPRDASGHWSSVSVIDTATAATGSVAWLRRALTDGSLSEGGAVGGAASMSPLHGYVATNTFSGPLTVQFAQVTSSATPVSIIAGSWLRATPII